MKFADRFLYTMWIMWLVMFFMFTPAVNERLMEGIWSIGGIWLFCFAAGGFFGTLAIEHLGKHKHQELERFRFNKRFAAKLLNVFCLFVWNLSPNSFLSYLTDWDAIVVTVIAGVFSGYVYFQDIRRLFFRLIDVIFPDGKEELESGAGVEISQSLIERDMSDLSLLDRARATLAVPAHLVDGD